MGVTDARRAVEKLHSSFIDDQRGRPIISADPVVYAIQTFSNTGLSDTGTVFLDDMSFVVPEPTSALAMSLGGLVLVARRRRAS